MKCELCEKDATEERKGILTFPGNWYRAGTWQLCDWHAEQYDITEAAVTRWMETRGMV